MQGIHERCAWAADAVLALGGGRDSRPAARLLAPPSLVIADTDTVAALIRRLDLRTATYRWEYPLAEEDLTVGKPRLTADFNTVENKLNAQVGAQQGVRVRGPVFVLR